MPREEANEPPGYEQRSAAAQLAGVPPPAVPLPGSGGAPQMGMMPQAQQQQGDGQQGGLQWPPPPFPPGGGQPFGYPPMQPFGMQPFGAYPMPPQPGLQQFPGGPPPQ